MKSKKEIEDLKAYIEILKKEIEDKEAKIKHLERTNGKLSHELAEKHKC